MQIWKRLGQLWWLNMRLGWPERLRGLHYWLGFEYALVVERMALSAGARLLDIGTGAYSVFPYQAAYLFGVLVTAVDIDPGIRRQVRIRERATHAGLCGPGQVHLLQADARALPFRSGTFDAFTAISVLEHVPGRDGPGEALAEAARVLRHGGRGTVTLPYRHEETMPELDEHADFFQWHFSAESLGHRLVKPSGLREVERIYYGERLPFYALARRLPALLDWPRRPWDTLLTGLFLRPVTDPAKASAVCVTLNKS